MINKIIRVSIGILGMLLGYGIVTVLKALEILSALDKGWLGLTVHLGIILLFGIILFSLSSNIINRGKKILSFLKMNFKNFQPTISH